MYRYLMLVAVLTLGLMSSVSAQTGSVPDYILGADDVIEISVRNHSDLNKTVTILADGKIGFPEVGELVAAGKTSRALASEIQTVLEKTRNKCEVVISVKEVHSKHVRIVGAVKTSNAFDLKRGWRLMDLVAVAGGFTVKPARITGRLVKASGKLIPLNIAEAMAKPDTDANPSLEPEDLVLLEETDTLKQISVMGQVTKPGTFDLTETTSLLSLISDAGSPNESAALSKAYVLRGGAHLPLNLAPALLKGQNDPRVTNFKLQPGDVLFIPEIAAKYAVLGQVTKPGYFPVSEKEELTVLKVLSQAGGPTQEADLRRANILRMVDGKAVSREINIEEMIKKGKLAENVVLQADEMLVIPPRNRKVLSFTDFLNPFTTLLSLGLLRR